MNCPGRKGAEEYWLAIQWCPNCQSKTLHNFDGECADCKDRRILEKQIQRYEQVSTL